VTDYFSYIVSVGKLYPEFSDNPLKEGNAYFVGHIRSGRKDDPYPEFHSFIHDVGRLNVTKLRDYLDPEKARDKTYSPDEDLKILNIISWTRVNHPTWQGGRVGKKLYPSSQLSRWSGNLPEAGRTIYVLRTGFFTSVRPGINSLLLNINTTTSAFFAPVSLQQWISTRRGTTDLQNIRCELKNVRVTFEGDTGINEGKKRVIRDIHNDTISNVRFIDAKGRLISVSDHMNTSKSAIISI